MNAFLLGAWLSVCAGDAVTTHIGLRMGAHEMFLRQDPVVTDVIIGGQALSWAVGAHLLRRDHPRWALGATIALTALRAWAVWHNVGVIRGMR